jgi:surface polysaccharide O-acyltransferase-like enzyme
MDFISLLRFVATILITNSHFDVLFPEGFKTLATGGMIGNALFFLCSGYTLFQSNRSDFFKWYTKRYLRIVMSVWIFMLLTTVILKTDYTWIDLFYTPTIYWFLRAILVFYILFFFITKYGSEHLGKIIFLFSIPLLISFFLHPESTTTYMIENTKNPYYTHYFYLFPVMLFGAWLSREKFEFKLSFYNSLMLLFVALVSYYGFKAIIIHKKWFVIQPILPVFLLFFVFMSFLLSKHVANFNFTPKVKNLINQISHLTLDIYVVQFAVIRLVKHFDFPIGVLLAVLGIAIASLLQFRVSNFIFERVKKYL